MTRCSTAFSRSTTGYANYANEMQPLTYWKSTWPYLSILIGVPLVDLASKYIVTRVLRENESVQIIGDFVRFTLVYNSGTTFGLFEHYEPYIAISLVKFLTIIILAVCLANVSRFISNAKQQMVSRLCISAIIGGSLANLVDRLLDTKVADFLDIGVSSFRWYTFNLADACQVIGGLTLLCIMAVQHFKTSKV
jgi:signal peptidase II